MNIQEKITRIKRAHDLLEDLAYRFDKDLDIHSCDAQNYSHYYETYPRDLFDSMSKSLDLLDDWLKDLKEDLRDSEENDDFSLLNDERKAV